MKTIKLFDKDMSIEKEYKRAVCIWETTGSNLITFEDVTIKLAQTIYNVKILETGSIIFTLAPNDEEHIVTMFPQMFGFPTEEQLNEIERLENVIFESQNKITEIYDNIERAGHTDINL